MRSIDPSLRSEINSVPTTAGFERQGTLWYIRQFVQPTRGQE